MTGTRSTGPAKIAAGHYRIGDTDIVRITTGSGRSTFGWVTRSRFDPRETYDWYDRLADAVTALSLPAAAQAAVRGSGNA